MIKDEVLALIPTLHADWELEYNNESGEPVALVRKFYPIDFLSGSKFVHCVASLAEINNHYPDISLYRKIEKKEWNAVSSVRCHTFVLGGLSRNDFFFAMLVDVECDKPNIAAYLKS